MLGEKLYEMTGTVQGQRVLPEGPEGPRMEITFGGPLQGHGRLSAFKGVATATYSASARADGSFHGEGQGIVMGADGGGFTMKGFGLGRIAGGKFVYRGAVTFGAPSEGLGWLKGVVGVFEYEQDLGSQGVTFTCYEWK